MTYVQVYEVIEFNRSFFTPRAKLSIESVEVIKAI